MSYRDAITKTYAKSVERQIKKSVINEVSFKKQAKRIDNEWDIRWVWNIQVSDQAYAEQCKWEGFKTLPACLKDMDIAISKITKKQNDVNKENNK